MEADFADFLGRRILIVGEVASGKTKLLSEFLDYLVKRGFAAEVTLIEMSPSFVDVGRPVEEYTKSVGKVRYLKPSKIYPPRMLGRSKEDVLYYAEHNYRELKPLLSKFAENPSKILLIDDLTIFLHAGETEEILQVMEKCETFVATAYEGSALRDDKGSGITFREQRLLSELKNHVDRVIELAKP